MKIVKLFSSVNFLLLVLLSSNIAQKTLCDDIDIFDPTLYKNEICSYNGRAKINGNTIKCTCHKSYVDEPRQKFIKYINGQKIQCSYHKKSRFIALFWAALLPLGLDFLYLGRYSFFAAVFIPFLLMVASQIICIFVYYNLKRLLYEEKHRLNKTKNNRILGFIKVNNKKDTKEKFEKFVQVYKIISRIHYALFIFYWIVDIVLETRGMVNDKNNVETENDLSTLFSKEDY